jgi:purine-binding chemotaxis protein CheW
MSKSAAASAEMNSREPAEWGFTEMSSTGVALTKFISFAIGEDQYGIDIMSVREIKGWSDVSNLPKQPDYVRGVLNLRGVIVPIVDLRLRFGQGQTAATPSHIVMIAQIEQRLVGLLADRVLDIVSVDGSTIQPVPKISSSTRVDFLSGLVTVEGSLIALIDLPRLLSGQDEDDGLDQPLSNPMRANARSATN